MTPPPVPVVPEGLEYRTHSGVRLVPPSSAGDVWLHIGITNGWASPICFTTAEGGEIPVDTILRACDAVDERRNLEALVDVIDERMTSWPDAHVYHFGGHEVLCDLVLRHGTCEQAVDAWLGEDRLVDLEAVLSRSFCDGATGMAAASTSRAVWELDRRLRPYAESLRVLDAFEDHVDRPAVWREEYPDHWAGLVEDLPGSEPESYRRACELIDAAVGFFGREDMVRRWQHALRLDAPARVWQADHDVLTVVGGDAGAWVPKRVNRHRALSLELSRGPVAAFDPGAGVRLVYDERIPGMAGSSRGRGWTEAVVVSHVGTRLEVKAEVFPMRCDPPLGLPVAVLPSPTVRTAALAGAALTTARTWSAMTPEVPHDALGDILVRRGPRLASGGGLPLGADARADVEWAVRDLDRSYLAVDGPPGSGKTRIAASVVASLVDSGWRVGVVSQSHRAVENVLDQAIAHGLDRALVAKEPKRGTPRRPYHRSKPEVWLEGRSGGALVGGTVWQFCRAGMQRHLPLDVLVVDEAGSFPLAHTIAMGRVAERILLLGDTRQLPPVTHAIHPHPVDDSVLAWLAGGRTALPDHMGYRLPQSRRLRGELAEVLAEVAYPEGLPVHPDAGRWRLRGVEPGVHPIGVHHVGRTTHAPEEVAAVVDIVASHVGRLWSGQDAPRALTADDVMVLAAYQGQADALREALADVGLADVQVGLVDRFQGGQAVVVVMSMTASGHADVPRGPGFLLSRERLTTALSRAQWATYVVHSPALRDLIAATPCEQDALDAFRVVVDSA